MYKQRCARYYGEKRMGTFILVWELRKLLSIIPEGRERENFQNYDIPHKQRQRHGTIWNVGEL